MKRTLYTMLRGFELKRSRQQIETVLNAVQAPAPPDGLRDRLLAQVPMSAPRRSPRLAYGMVAVGLVLVVLAATLWPKPIRVAKSVEGPKFAYHNDVPTPPEREITTVPPPPKRAPKKPKPQHRPNREPEREEVAMKVTVERGEPNSNSSGRIVALSTDAQGREVRTELTFRQDTTGQRKEDSCVTDSSGEQHKISTIKSNRVAEAEGEKL